MAYPYALYYLFHLPSHSPVGQSRVGESWLAGVDEDEDGPLEEGGGSALEPIRRIPNWGRSVLF